MQVYSPNSSLSQAPRKVGEDSQAEGQDVAIGQSFSHWHILNQIVVWLSTKNKFIVPVEQKGLVFPLPKNFPFQASEVGDQ